MTGYVGTIGSECLHYLSCDQPEELQNDALTLFRALIAHDADRIWWLLTTLSTSDDLQNRYGESAPSTHAQAEATAGCVMPLVSWAQKQTHHGGGVRKDRENRMFAKNCAFLFDFMEQRQQQHGEQQFSHLKNERRKMKK